jgi:hypothetical protein
LGLAFAASILYLGFTYFEGWRLYILALPFLLDLGVSAAVVAGVWKKQKPLEMWCLATILLNLSTIVLLMVVNW